MKKFMMTAAMALVLGAGAAVVAPGAANAQTSVQVAQLSPRTPIVTHSFRFRPAVPLGTSAMPVGSWYGNANSGMPDVPGAPTATTVYGGGQ